MNTLLAVRRRLYNSSVLWSWALTGFRMASGLLVLPLLFHRLSKPDFGMYQLFLLLGNLVPIIDFGFSISVNRYVSYAMGGAVELKAEGMVPNERPAPPNFPLLWRLLVTTQRLFRHLSCLTVLVLGGIGTAMVAMNIAETSSSKLTWFAWAVTLISAVLEIYAGWWNLFLRGMNQVLLSARILVLAYGLKLAIAIGLLLADAGLLALPVAGLLTSLLQRQLSRRSCLKLLGPPPATGMTTEPSLLGVLWPNSWRAGLQFLSGYLVSIVNAFLCTKIFKLSGYADYGLSVQVAGIVSGMAAVWTAVKWPLVGQYRTQQNHEALRRVLWPRVWLQAGTFILLAVAAVWLGPVLLKWHGSGKQLLPLEWFTLLLLASFMDLQFSFWTTLLSTENRIPSLWPTVITNLCTVVIVLPLITFTSLGLGALVIAPLLTGCLFNYWYWPVAGARSLQTGWWRFTLCRPH